jgi:hypothetical protein
LLGSILAHVFRDVAEPASTRQIHPSGSLSAGGLTSDPSARLMTSPPLVLVTLRVHLR